MSPRSNDICPYTIKAERDLRQRHTETRPCEDRDRDRSDVSASQGAPRTGIHHQKLGESPVDSAPEPPVVNNPTDTLILDFWPPELQGTTFFAVLNHMVCGTLTWQP